MDTGNSRSPATASRSAWMAKEHGGTTCSSSGCGAASNTRRYICGPTKALARRGTRSAVISTSIIAAVHIRALTATHRIKPTSTRRQSVWRLNPGRCSTYRYGDSVQTTGTSSVVRNKIGSLGDQVVDLFFRKRAFATADLHKGDKAGPRVSSYFITTRDFRPRPRAK